jgi:low affinity Fe/Cu permease
VRNSSLSIHVSTILHHHTLLDLQTQRNIAIPILVVLLENIRHALQTNARLDEQIETQRIPAAAVVCLIQQRDEALRETVAECDESFVELGERYAAAMIGVEAVEKVAPRGEEAP